MDENLKFFLPLVTGALIAGLFGVFGAWIANVREHRQWLRDHKVAVYTEFLKQSRLIAIRLDEALSLRRDAMDPLREANRQISTTAIRIAAPEKVGSASNRVQKAIRVLGDKAKIRASEQEKQEYLAAQKAFWKALDELEDLMRADLKIRD